MTTTATTTAAEERRAAAREAYRVSVAAGDPLTGAELGARYDRGERWGRDRINEARAEVRESSPVRLPGEVPLSGLPPVATPPRMPEDAAAMPERHSGNAADAGTAETAEMGPADAAEGDAAAVERQTENAETAMLIMGGNAARAADAGTAETAMPEVPAAAAETAPEPRRAVRVWPVWLLMLPAAVAIWGGWVGLGEMAGFGPVRLLPGIYDPLVINTAITLPIGMEVYAAYALYVWLSGRATGRALPFARGSAITALVVGALGQVAYHVMAAAGVGVAPWWITAAVACLPVAVLGMGAALAHMVHAEAE